MLPAASAQCYQCYSVTSVTSVTNVTVLPVLPASTVLEVHFTLPAHPPTIGGVVFGQKTEKSRRYCVSKVK